MAGARQILALGLILCTYKVNLGGGVIVFDSREIFGAGKRKVTRLVMTSPPPELRSGVYTPRNRRGRLELFRGDSWVYVILVGSHLDLHWSYVWLEIPQIVSLE